jgi:hypothetical protein
MNSIFTKKIHRDYFFALAIFFILSANYFLMNMFGVDKDLILINRWICFFGIFVVALLKLGRSSSLLYLFLFLFGFLSLNNPVALGFSFSILFSLAFSDLNSIDLIKIQFRTLGFILFIWLLSYSLGLLQNELFVDHYAAMIDETKQERLRYSLGFSNPNQAASIMTSFVLLGLAASAYKVMPIMFYLTVAILGYLITDSRSAILAPILFVLFKYFINLLSTYNARKWFTLIVVFTPFLATLFSYYIVYYCPIVDVLFSYRLIRVANYFSEFSSLNLLFGGAPLPSVAIDNSFALIMSLGGIALSLFVIYFTCVGLLNCIKYKRQNIYAFIASFWVYSFFESSLLRPELLIGLTFWHLLIPGRKKIH